MEIQSVKEEHIKSLAKHLAYYWKARGLDYSEQWAEEYVREGHKKEIVEDRFFVALENGKVIGSMSVILWEGRLAELRDLFVKEEFRGKGIADALFEACLKYSKEKKARKIIALIFPYLFGFFEKRGFVREGLLKNQAKDGENLVIMSKFF